MKGSHNSVLWVRNVFLEGVVLSSVIEGGQCEKVARGPYGLNKEWRGTWQGGG